MKRIPYVILGQLAALSCLAQSNENQVAHSPVPDSGATAVLVLLAFGGLALLRRRKS